MKFFIILACLLSFSALAEPLCDENGNPIDALSALATPNCLNEKYLGPALENYSTELCGTCKTNFQKFVKDPILSPSKDERQKQFLEAAFKEYQKILTENLYDALKLRAMRPTGGSLTKSIKSCQMRSLSDFASSCSSKKSVELLQKSDIFEKFNKSISIELGKILSTDPSYTVENALLKRNPPACFIPEKDLLYISISALEEVVTPDFINIITSVDPSKYSSLEELIYDDKIMENFPDLDELSAIISSFKTHPLLSDKFTSPMSAINFLKQIRDPKAVENLRELIYNKSNGDNYDSKLASKCDESFKTIKSAICSADFENGKFNLNPFQNHEKLFSKKLSPTGSEFTTTPDLEKKNIDLLKLCSDNTDSKINLSSVFHQLDKSLNPNYIQLSLDQYKNDKHDKDLGKLNENLCQRQSQNCTDNTYACKVLQKYKALKNPNSVDFKLANSSNKEVNELLRSMIGDTSRIDSKTKEILIAQGIIPKDDGTMTAQADIPERQPDFAQKEAQQAQASATITPGKAAAASSKQSAGRNPASDNSLDEGYSSSNTRSASATLPDFSDLMDDQQELRGIQDEIKRRLLGMPENKPASKEDAKRLVRDSFKSRKRNLTPEMEDAFASRLMQPQAAAPQTAAASNFATPQANPENRAQVSGGESAQQKWKNSQDQKALMGMKGAQDVLNKENSNTQAASAESKPKELTKVALNIAEDPQVRLSDLFNKKIDQNDSETQLLKVLLRNKNNFLLQIKSMNFKIIFDEKNNFNVLLESGDRSEADRIRPQLELFLKKLKP
jgi:hypothetical protein